MPFLLFPRILEVLSFLSVDILQEECGSSLPSSWRTVIQTIPLQVFKMPLSMEVTLLSLRIEEVHSLDPITVHLWSTIKTIKIQMHLIHWLNASQHFTGWVSWSSSRILFLSSLSSSSSSCLLWQPCSPLSLSWMNFYWKLLTFLLYVPRTWFEQNPPVGVDSRNHPTWSNIIFYWTFEWRKPYLSHES